MKAYVAVGTGPLLKAAVGSSSPVGRSALVKSRLLSLLYFTFSALSLEKSILSVQQLL